jgi:hypothetical protein
VAVVWVWAGFAAAANGIAYALGFRAQITSTPNWAVPGPELFTRARQDVAPPGAEVLMAWPGPGMPAMAVPPPQTTVPAGHAIWMSNISSSLEGRGVGATTPGAALAEWRP